MGNTLTKEDIESGKIGREALIALHRETVNEISEMSLIILPVKVEINLGDKDLSFIITIFDGTEKNDNRHFFFYDWLYVSNLKRNLAQAMALIKSGNFGDVKLFFDD